MILALQTNKYQRWFRFVATAMLLVFVFNFALVDITLAQQPNPTGPASQGLANAQTVLDTNSGKSIFELTLLWGLNAVLTSTLFLTARFMGLAGWFFDFAFGYNLDGFIKNRNIINQGWAISRDIANIFFILIILIIAIATILGLESYGTKALLGKLIAVALLINFSLAIGFLIIDFSNVLGKGFYDALVPDANSSISGSLMKGTAVAQIFNLKAPENQGRFANYALGGALGAAAAGCGVGFVIGGPAGCAVGALSKGVLGGGLLAGALAWFKWGTKAQFESASNYFYVIMMSNILVFPLTFVFLFGGILLAIRFAVLAFLLILAPIAYLSYILPDTRGKIWQKWWDQFLNHAFFMPAFMFLLYFAILLTNQWAGATFVGGVQADGSFLFNTILIIVVLISSLLIAKQMGVYAAGAVLNYAKTGKQMLTGYAGGVALRNTVGRVGEKMQSREGIQRSYYGRQLAQYMAGAGGGMKGVRMAPIRKVEEDKADASLKKSPKEFVSEYMKHGTIAREVMLQKMPEKDRGRFYSDLKTANSKAYENATKVARVRYGAKAEEDMQKAERRNRRMQALAGGEKIGKFMDDLGASAEADEERLAHFKDMGARDQGELLSQWQSDVAKKDTITKDWVPELDIEKQGQFYAEAMRRATPAVKAEIFDGLSEDMQNKTLETMPNREVVEMKKNAGAYTTKVENAIKRLPTEKQEKVREEEARDLVKDLDILAASWPTLTEEIKKVVSNIASRDELQKIAGKVADTGKFVEDVNKHAPTRASEVIAVLPGEASKIGKTTAQAIATSELDKIPEAHGKTIAKDIAENMRSKQLPKLIDRSDALTDSVLQEVQKMYDAAGKSIIKLADTFDAINNRSMANWLRTTKNPKQVLGLK